MHKKQRRDRPRTADPNWPNFYSIAYCMLSNKSCCKKRKVEVLGVTAFVFSRNCYVRWALLSLEQPACQQEAANSLFCFVTHVAFPLFSKPPLSQSITSCTSVFFIFSFIPTWGKWVSDCMLLRCLLGLRHVTHIATTLPF